MSRDVEGPDSVRLDAPIGSTDRGTLWRATRHQTNDRIVRFVESRFCDERFRAALTDARQKHHAHAVEIAGEGWAGGHYYIEYDVGSPVLTLGELLAFHPHWTGRVAFLSGLCDTLARWQGAVVPPHGVNLHDIVGSETTLRLLPCPSVVLSSPDDLFGTEPAVLAGIAPEYVRGVPLNRRAQDRYALGTLAAHVIGCSPSPLAAGDDARIETQARGALLVTTPARSAVEPFLRELPQIRRLFSTIEHYRHPVPDARPLGFGELRSALTAAADLPALAQELRDGNPAAAITVLGWAEEHPLGRLIDCLLRAAEICVEEDDPGSALPYLDRAADLSPNHIDVRRQRAEALWMLLAAKPDEPTRVEDLTADLEFVAGRSTEDGDRITSWLRAAEAYRRVGDHASEADALYKANKLDGGNLDALLRYGRCLAALDDCDGVKEVVRLAKHRIPTMAAAGRISEREVDRWIGAFDALCE